MRLNFYNVWDYIVWKKTHQHEDCDFTKPEEVNDGMVSVVHWFPGFRNRRLPFIRLLLFCNSLKNWGPIITIITIITIIISLVTFLTSNFFLTRLFPSRGIDSYLDRSILQISIWLRSNWRGGGVPGPRIRPGACQPIFEFARSLQKRVFRD